MTVPARQLYFGHIVFRVIRGSHHDTSKNGLAGDELASIKAVLSAVNRAA